MLNYHNPTLVALLETHLHDQDSLKTEFGLTHMAQSPAEGLFVGLALLWKNDMLKLDQVAVTRQEIHYIVQVPPNPNTWLLSVIYAKNDLFA